MGDGKDKTERKAVLSLRTVSILLIGLCVVAAALLLVHVLQNRNGGSGKSNSTTEDPHDGKVIWKPVTIEYYDAEEQLRYTVKYEYDELARVICEDQNGESFRSYRYEPSGVVIIDAEEKDTAGSGDFPDRATVTFRTKYEMGPNQSFYSPQVEYDQAGRWTHVGTYITDYAAYTYDEKGRLEEERQLHDYYGVIYVDEYEYDEENENIFRMNRYVTYRGRSDSSRESYEVEIGKKTVKTIGNSTYECVYETSNDGMWETRRTYQNNELISEETLWHHPYEEWFGLRLDDPYGSNLYKVKKDEEGNPTAMFLVDDLGNETMIAEYDETGRIFQNLSSDMHVTFRYDSDGKPVEITCCNPDTGSVIQKIVVEYKAFSLPE